MATMSHAESRRMYSWWWNSHISPKNSRWLQENLTDMDGKVKSMIKLIEEDADSFARRAEMYYKKRPELMKLVEEFYRAYRALAERYDHATGALRQAHRTMAEVFPNQVPSVLTDDTPTNYASETDPHTPEMSPPIPALFDPDDFNGIHSEEYDSVITNKKGLKQFDDIFGNRDDGKSGKGRARRGINFDEAEEEEQSSQSNENHITQDTLEKEIQKLREALLKLEAEKKASLAQQKQCLDKFSQQEVEFSKAQEDSKGLTERANKAEGEVQSLKKSLSELEAGKEVSLLQYQKCLERIDNLETVVSHAHQDAIELSERAHKAEIEAQALKQDLAMAKSEKDASINQYKQSLELISTIENKLTLAEENAKKLDEQAHRAECEAETLKQALAKLTEEKEATALQHLQCLETISSLEYQNSCAQEEAQRLNRELETGVAKINGAEAQCLLLERSNQSLHSELESSMLRVLAQNEKLTEKQQELGRLGACIQEERLRYMEAETAFQTLQHLHSQTQGELKSLASELQNRTQLLSDIETHNRTLQDEVLKIKEENESLNELNLSSSMTIKDMQNEIISLRETEGKLKEEVELRVDQRNALQQEIYCLKEEQNAMNKKYHAMLDQVEAVGFNLECFESSVKALQDENSNLKETHENEMREKACLFEKLEILETVVEKNDILEKSLSDLSAELEGTRKKMNAMEASFQSLSGEKSSLVSEKACLLTQLQEATENLEKISEKNSFLENSISDAHDELEGLKAKLKRLEDSCQLLENEKSNIIAEKATLISKVEITQKSLEDLEMNYRNIEEKYSDLEKEKEFTLCEVEGLQRKARESEQKVEKQTTEIENLCGKLLNMKMSCETLQEENVKLLDERISLKKDFLELQGKNYTLEEEYFSIIGETESLSNLSLVFKIIINEKSLELKELCIALDKLHGVNGAFEDKIRMMGGKLEEAQVEILRLKELLKTTEDELSAVKFVNGQLTYEIANGKDLLCQKEAELSEAKCKVANTADEISKWQTVVVDLKRKYDDAKILQNQANSELEAELQKRNNEIGVWEGEFTTVFSELQISSVFQAVLEEKFHELIGEWKYLKDESTIKNTGIELLKERVSTLEGKNGSLKAQLAAYAPAINSLQECICSLENHTCLHMKLQDSNNGKIKDADFGCHHHVERHEGLSEDQKERNHFLELQDLQARVKVVDKTVIETNTKLEAATRQIEELISKGASNQENVKPLSENSELENGILTKDIMLDQISECSSYGIGRIECANTDSQGIEPWNIADLRGKLNLTVGNEKKTVLTKKETEFNSEILVEKELGVDKLAISKRFLQPHQEVDKTKILERLDSDGQKLTNLQITVQDLKGKVEMSEKSEKGKSFGECNTMKGQLEKAEEAILKLFELNGQLMKSVEKFDGTTAMESEESGNLRRRTSEQARRMSERIGELQLEVQKIQFVLLKLKHESEKERKVKTETAERTRRVVLRDYLGLRTITRRKKGGFCACVRPQTSGD